MNFKIKKEYLLKYLNYVIKGISNKNIRPILNCIYFELSNSGLILKSSDNDISIMTTIPISMIEDGYKEGKFVVNGRYFYDIIRKFPNEIIDIEEVIDSKVFISYKNSSLSLNCNIVEDFPDIDFNGLEKPIVLDTKIFKNIISQTAFATSTQESRPSLTGLNIQIIDSVLYCRATDSHRLSEKKIKLYESNNSDVNIIVPVKNIVEVTKMIGENDDNIEIHIFSNKIIFITSDIVIMSRLINGDFPDFSRLIPNNFNLSFNIDVYEFYGMLDRVSLFSSSEEDNTIKLEVIGNKVIIKSPITEIGSGTEETEITKNDNVNLRINFNVKYMMEAIKIVNTDQITLLFNKDIDPVVIMTPNDDSLIQLFVPVRV